MKNKKDDHDELEATHINQLWERDLDKFIEVLTIQEEKDEKDRSAHKAMKGGDGKKQARKKVAKKGQSPAPKKNDKKKAADKKSKSPNAAQQKEKSSPSRELTLRERLAMQ